MPTQDELRKGFTIGDWDVLPAQGVLRSRGREERPEPLVFEVLLVLAAAGGDLVTRDELIDEVWQGRPTADEPVNRCLSLLRGHLGDRSRPYRYIETLTRRGYRLVEPVRLLEPAGASAEQAGARSTPPPGRVRRRLVWALAGALAAVVAVGVLLWFGMVEPVGVRSADSVRSVAVLPFDNLSGVEEDQYLVSGFKEELVQTLSQIPGLVVKHGRVAYPDLEVGQIAELLGVEAVLFGAVQRDGDALKISYHIVDGDSGGIVSSGSFTGRVEAIFGLQERLAVMVRDDLVGASPQQLVSMSRPENFAAYDRYMRGMYAFERRTIGTNLEEAIRLFEETIELDPQFGPAYLSLATAYALLPDYRDAPLEASHRRAIEIVERGIAVDDSIREAASAVFGFVYHKQRKWLDAEQAYQRAIRAQVVDSNAFNWYARMLAAVGRRQEALDQALAAQHIDPSSAVINGLVAVIYTWLGDAERAEEYYLRSSKLGAAGMNQMLGHALLHIRDGRYEEARRLAREGAIVGDGNADWVDAVFAAIDDPTRRSAALSAVDAAAGGGTMDPRIELVLRTLLDDLDGAMKIAASLAEPGTYYEIDVLFLPELRPLRELPGFEDLMARLGVQAYWDAKGCVWLDDAVSCPD